MHTDSDNQIERFLAKLKKVRQSGDGWTALCPAHDDRERSLSVGTGDEDKVLIKCFAGCTYEEILEAIDLKPSDLFPNSSHAPKQSKRVASGNGLLLADYAKAKGFNTDFLQQVGVSQIYIGGNPVVSMPYRDSGDKETAVRYRHALHKGEHGDGRFTWRKNSKLCLYGEWRREEMLERKYTTLAEGESDPQTLWLHNEPALGIPGANNWNEERDAPVLNGFEKIYLINEGDKGWEAIEGWLRESSIRQRVYIVDLGEYKDPSELYLTDPDNFLANWKKALDDAVAWHEIEEKERQEQAKQFYELAAPLLHDPKLLENIANIMRVQGYAGDLTPPTVAYVAITSRLLSRPQNVAFVAQSAAGKNRAVDAAVELMPEEAVYIMPAGSERALIYTNTSYQSRTVIVEEADSIPEDGPAATAVRNLAAANKMEYDVVEKDPRSGQHVTRRISKPGPTGLITTSTKSLPPQMNTRTLEIAIRDDESQTREVMLAHARSVAPPKAAETNLKPYIALQQWLQIGGARHVSVPFAAHLANLLPAKAVRMRRDFRQLLTCIESSALLYQLQRERTPEGWVIATINDYATARELLLSIFITVNSEGASPAVRQTVQKVIELSAAGESNFSITKIAEVLNLSKSTVSWRVNKAVEGGWLKDNRTSKNGAAKIEVGDPLPDETDALPTPDEVQRAYEGLNEPRAKDAPPPPSDTEAIEDPIEEVLQKISTEPEEAGPQQCYTCKGTVFWKRPSEAGGGLVCSTCHPNPQANEEA